MNADASRLGTIVHISVLLAGPQGGLDRAGHVKQPRKAGPPGLSEVDAHSWKPVVRLVPAAQHSQAPAVNLGHAHGTNREPSVWKSAGQLFRARTARMPALRVRCVTSIIIG